MPTAAGLDRVPGGADAGHLRAAVRALRNFHAGTPRLDDRLALLARASSTSAAMRRLGLDGRGNEVRVVVSGGSHARAAVLAAGGTVEARSGALVQALLSGAALARVARAAGVQSVRPPAKPYALAIPGEGVGSTGANVWQNAGVRGAGVRVAIIDTGFGGLAAAQAAGEVPQNVVTVDYCGGQFGVERHGTAVAEIVSEEAPSAQLYLICIDSEVTLAEAEAFAAQNGVSVVNHSVGWFNTWSGDGRGPAGTPDAVVAAARAHNILWVNAAGNEAENHWGGTFTDADGDQVHEWSPGDEVNNALVRSGGVICALLRWNEWPNAQHDYDLALMDNATGKIIAVSTHDQATLRDAPVEETCVQNVSSGTRLVGAFVESYEKYSSAARLDLFIEGVGPIERSTPAGSIADPAASPNALTVGAVCWQSNGLEPFSSQGPTIDGRVKPDLVAPDSISGFTYGMFTACGQSAFPGTSAAAPYVAGAAALVKERFPNLDAAALQSYLVSHAGDLGPAGPDFGFGAGRLLLPAPVAPEASYPGPATEITRNHAVLAATVNPEDSRTSVKFELGTTTAYGSAVDAQPLEAGVGPQTERIPVDSLSPGTTYHYRVVATNLGGTTTGADQTFTTLRDYAPTVHAISSKGRFGHNVRLGYQVGDDTGSARSRVDVYRGSARIASRSIGFKDVSSATRVSVTWHAPAKGRAFKFCVQAFDRAGNASARSCAPISLH